MICAIHELQDKEIVVVVDSELVGKVFEEENKILDLTSEFFQGQEKTDSEISDILRNSDLFNLTGEKAVNLGIKEGLIDPDRIVKIDGILHAEGVVEHE